MGARARVVACMALLMLAVNADASSRHLMIISQLPPSPPAAAIKLQNSKTTAKQPLNPNTAAVYPQPLNPISAAVQPLNPTTAVVQPQPLNPTASQPVLLLPGTPPQTIYITQPAATCTSISDTDMPNGRLCISQVITTTTTTVQPGCNSYFQNCLKTEEVSKLVTPQGTALTNVKEFNDSAVAACKQLGYATAGNGSVHMTGDSELAKQLCWNGQSWSTENWWVSLVCCK